MLRATLLAACLLPLGCRGGVLDISNQIQPQGSPHATFDGGTAFDGGGDYGDGGGCGGGGNVDLGPWTLDGGDDWTDGGYPVDLGPWILDGGGWPIDAY
jgi:hypothetical protein